MQKLMIKNKKKLEEVRIRLEELKKEFEQQQHINVIREFEILNEYDKLIRNIAGSYSIQKLADDFNIGFDRCKRILSFRKSNKRTWKLINEGKISAYIVTYILYRHNEELQDQIIDDAIKYNLSARALERIKSTNIENYKKKLNEKILDDGFKLKSNAYHSLCNSVDKVRTLLLIDINEFPETKHKIIIKKIKNLNLLISNWIKIHK